MDIEQRLNSIEERNSRVESDKAWEISYIRRILLTIFTYLAVALYLRSIEINHPWLNAIVPAAGFMISTLTMPIFKNIWLKHFYNK